VRITALGILALALLGPPPSPAGDQGRAELHSWRLVTTERLVQAMAHVQAYELTATSNGPRLQADVILELIREAQGADPEGRPLLIGHREWYEAFMARTGLPPSKAPIYVRRPYEMGQELAIDYRRERVVETVLKGPAPRLVANVWNFWARSPGKPDAYSYDDTIARPALRVTSKRLVRYRLVYYEDRLWYTEISGLYGRPTSGALGVLFDIIGEARVEESRSAFAPDGFQVVRGRASKWGMNRTETVTVGPDGHADRGVPAGRPDLVALEARLHEPLAIRFRPIPKEPD